MRFAHIAREVFAEPWMILPEKLAAIAELVALRVEGGRFSEEEVEARIGKLYTKTLRLVEIGTLQVHSFAENIDFGEAVGMAMAADASGTRKKNSAGMIAVIPISGVIMPKANLMTEMSGGTSIESLTRRFRQAMASPDVRAIVLDVDSPGGSVYGVDELAQEIAEAAASGQKKIVAQVNPLAASAAYYLASQASEIAVMPSGETGSIGVRMAHADYTKALEQKGIKVTEIAAGKYKNEGTPYAALGDEAKAFMQQRINEYYDAFVKAVARGRGVSQKAVREGFGQGRVVGAQEAVNLGMADRIATLDQTLARLGGDASVRIAASAENRSSKTATADTEEEMAEETRAAAAADAVTAVRSAAVLAENERIAGLKALGSQHPGVVKQEQVSAWIGSGLSVGDAKDVIMARLTETAKALPAPPVAAEGNGPGSGVEVITRNFEATYKKALAAGEVQKGEVFGRSVRAFARAKGNIRDAVKVAENIYGDKLAAGALSAGDQAGGGFLVPTVLAAEVIEFLRPLAIVRSLNPRVLPLVNGNLSVSKMTTGTTATYIGENKAAPATKPAFGQVKATAHKLAALVPISNDLVRYQGPSPAIDGQVRDDLVLAFKQAEDLAFIRGPGTTFSPKGLRSWAPAANLKVAAGGTSLANARAGLSALKLALRGGNVQFIRPGWIMSPRTENYLMWNAVDGNGNLVFNAQMLQGLLLNYPYRVTTLIPENLGGGTETEIYLADFSDVIIAENPQMVFEVSQEAAYDDGAGTLLSSFQLDQTLLKMIVEHDLIVRHPESIAILGGPGTTGPTWA